MQASEKKFDWMKYSLARINIIAQGRGGCGDVLPAVDDEVIIRFRESLSGQLDQDDRLMLGIYDSLKDCQEGTLGAAMWRYYRSTGHTPVDEQGTFPVRYIMLHDAHHVLINASTDDQGELDVLAFECGMSNQQNPIAAITPLLAQMQAFSSVVNIPSIAKWWGVGCKCPVNLLDTWDISRDINKDLATLKIQWDLL